MNIRPLNEHLQQTAISKLNEDPSRIKEDIEYVKEWLKKQPHLNARQDDQWILSFLRGSKFSLERVKKKLDSYYTFRTLAPEFLQNRSLMHPYIQERLDKRSGLVLPMDENMKGPAIFLTKCDGAVRNEENMINLIKLIFITLDIFLRDNDRAVVEGVVSVVDADVISMTDLIHFTPLIMRKIAKIFNHGYPLRTRAVHFVNTPPNFVTIFNLIKKLIHRKIWNRLYVHPNLESLHEHIPKASLPTEYGGTAGPYDELADAWRRTIESYESWLKEDEQYRTNEKLRPGTPKTTEELFNVTGSFRQLNVD